MFQMHDENGADNKVLAVPAKDPRMEHLRDIHHVPEFDRLEIQHFFEVYKALEPGKWYGPKPGRTAPPPSRDRSLPQAGGGNPAPRRRGSHGLAGGRAGEART